MKTMAKRSNIVVDDILLFQILPRMPARSLGRFKCVCKQWRSFLTTPVFTKMHLQHVNNNQNDHNQLFVSTTKPWRYFRIIHGGVGSFSNPCLPFKANSSNEISILSSSLNGLVCVGIDYYSQPHKKYSDIILWNPLTGDYKTLSKDDSDANCFTIPARGYGFYYTCCDDDYKLLRITKSRHAYIYSLKSDSWRKVESTSCRLLEDVNSSCLSNENLYLLGQGGKSNKIKLWSSFLIIRFDTKTETFTEIAAPSFGEQLVSPYFSLTVVSGCIHLCVISVSTKSMEKLELWKMDGETGAWKNVLSCVQWLSYTDFYQPLHMMKNGNWLVGSTCYGYVHEVDLEMKTKKDVYTPTPNDVRMDFRWGGKFVETIVSLN